MQAGQTILIITANNQLRRITTYSSGAMFKPSLTNSMGTVTINTSKDSRQITVMMVASVRTTTMTSITTMITRITTTARLSKIINKMILAITEKIRTMVEDMVETNMTLDRVKVISQRQTTTEVIHIKRATNLTSVVPLNNLKIRLNQAHPGKLT